MGFNEAAQTPDERTIVEALKEALHSPEYIENPDQVFDNIDSDGLIPDRPSSGKPASRSELIRSHSPTRSPDEIVRRTADFCHQHIQEGPQEPVAQENVLGCVRGLESVADCLASSSGLDLSQARSLLRDLSSMPDGPARLTAQRADLGDLPLSQYQMWGFYDPPHADPFAALGTKREEIVRRLGLGPYENTSRELVCWAHRLPPSITAHRPTAWDADVMSQSSVHWRPGGRTQPLHGSNSDEGFAEVVHAPISARQFTIPMVSVEA